MSHGTDEPRTAAPGLAAPLTALGLAIMTCAVLGPLMTQVLVYRTSPGAASQIAGGDLAALVVVGPLCLVTAWTAHRGHAVAPFLALAPSVYALYMYSQLIIGNEYLDEPGNVERFFPLLLAVVLLAALVFLRAWTATGGMPTPETSSRFDRTVGVVLLLVAAYVVLGLHAGSYLDAIQDAPQDPQYLGAPTAFWAVKLWDLGVVAPAAVVVGAGMIRRRAWARRPMFALLGGYVLLGCSVTGMAWTMYVRNDPGGSLAGALVATAVLAALLTAACALYRPILVTRIRGGERTGPVAVHAPRGSRPVVP